MPGVVAIVQARMSSARLPGKVLQPILGVPMVEHVARRVSRSRAVDQVILATSTDSSDDLLANWCQKSELAVVRGSLDDVLGRFVQAARCVNADVVVRVTADCPLIDPEIIDAVVEAFWASKCDYASNACLRSFPRGLDVEVVKTDILRKIDSNPSLLFRHREHVTPFIYENRSDFQVQDVVAEPCLTYPDWRWCVDEPADLRFVTQIYERLYPVNKCFGSMDIVRLVNSEPGLALINSAVQQKTH